MERDDYEEQGHFDIDLDGGRYRVPHHCPHRAGRLMHGHINPVRKTITCPLHHSVFCLESGVQLSGPRCAALHIEVLQPGSNDETVSVTSPEQPLSTSPDKDKPMHYMAEQVWTPFSESVLGWDDAFHDLMLNDRLRMRAYRQAIFEVIRPGDRVIDLGTGTGILSLWALEAGAAQVVGIEMNTAILELAVRRLEQAGFGDRFVPINRLSYDIELDERADVLISEIMGNIGDNENFQPILQDAINRFLKPAGRILPLSVTSYLVPVAAVRSHQAVSAGQVESLSPRYDIGQLYSQRAIRSPFNLYYDCILPSGLYLSDPRQLCRYADTWDQPATYTHELSYTLHAGGLLTGFKAYFVAQLSHDTVLDISGGNVASGDTSDSWKHAFLPIETPIEVRSGDVLQMTFSRRYPDGDSTGFQQVYEWRGRLKRSGHVIGEFGQRMGG
ncbi:50S ribosomal protein L11 methyltransferase [Pectobacterium betavasculorum]|uniref:50S ribosomal protein L11 methyltransferase n=1 Tax=Pectobacterium betavasculorum TaxID=55207 RepID=UPI00313E2A10